ncbi:MAG: hypothetical protein IK050_04740 [Lachnospiraceae bacterium]|nr:hypothetical protein [Lachnospiraceae bacterium]
MKFSHFASLFIITVLFVFFVGWQYATTPEINYNRANKQYGVVIANACVDGMKNTDPGLTDVFNTSAKREKALNSFYRSLLKGLNKSIGVRDYAVKEQTPFVLLIDNDGFYVSYNAVFDEYMTSFIDGAGNKINPDSADVELSTVTSLNTWSENIDGNVVRFYLNDHVKVITPDNKIYDGTREEVLSKVDIDCLKTVEAFETEKRYVIIQALEDEINFLLNSQPINAGKYYRAYAVTLPQSEGEDWHRLLKRPCLISFLQGKTSNNRENVLNVYGYAGGEIIKSKLFYGSGDLYYKYDGGSDNFGTMRDMAEMGLNPDVTAMTDN